MNQKILQLASAVAFAVVLVFNFLAATGRINETDTGAISDRYPTQLTPAGYAFTIWSLIYLGLAAFAVYQVLPSNRDRGPLGRIRFLFLISCAANVGWLVSWHYDLIPLSLVFMLALLVSLLLISDASSKLSDTRDVLFVSAPFNLYFGWVTVAAIVNASIALVATGTEPMERTGSLLGAALILAAAAIGTFVRFRLNAFLYPIAIAWGVTAIAIKQSGNTPIVAAAAVAVIVLLFGALWGAVKD